jgi:predicted MFS family arabinose efflux permease
MIGAEGVSAVAIGVLSVLVATGNAPYWFIPVAAFAEGTGAVVFGLSSTGAIKALVPPAQMPTAVSVSTSRVAAVNLAGPPVGGALFGLGRAVPFVVDFVSYVLSIVTLTGIRTPFQAKRELDPTRLRSQLAEGFRFLWSDPFIRATTFVYALGNVAVPALLLVVIVVGREQGLTGGQIGLLVAVFGACLLLGSLASGYFRRAFSTRTIILIELWAALGCSLFLIWPNVYVLLASMLPQAVAMPVTDSVVVGYRYAVTPERLVGRAESVRSTIARLLDPLGPLAAGLLLSVTSARGTVAVFVAWSAGLLLWGLMSSAIRNAPSLDEDLHAAAS